MLGISLFFLPACENVHDRRKPAARSDKKVAVTRTKEHLRMTLATTERRFSRKAKVPLSLEISNTGPDARKLSFSSAKTHDWLARNANGKAVWQWSYGKAFAQFLVSKMLNPGEKWTFKTVWRQETNTKRSAPVGKYRIEAELNTTGETRKIGYLEIELVE